MVEFSIAVPPVIVGLGELLWDEFPDGHRPGGAPANVAFHAAQLGARGVVLSRVGDDTAGRRLVNELTACGVDISAIQFDPLHHTGRVSVEFSNDGEPRYLIHAPVAWDRLEFTEQWQAVAASAHTICFGTLAQRDPVSRETIRRLLKQTSPGCLRVYDVNLRQNFYDVTTIETSLQLADVVKLNDHEAAVLAQLFHLSSETARLAGELLERFGLEFVVVTRGAEGCLAVSAEGRFEVAGTDSLAVDPVGAGDAFTSGLIWARLNHWSLENQLRLANALGGLVAGAAGAMPRMRAEFLKAIARFRPPS